MAAFLPRTVHVTTDPRVGETEGGGEHLLRHRTDWEGHRGRKWVCQRLLRLVGERLGKLGLAAAGANFKASTELQEVDQ